MSISPQISTPAVTPLEGTSTSEIPSRLRTENLDQVPFWRGAVILAMAVAVGLAYWFNPPLDVKAQAGVVMDLPLFVGNYFGTQGKISDVELNTLPRDTEFARRYYTDGRGNRIDCSIVLSGAEQRSIHRPEACLVGQGWTIVGQEDIPIPLVSGHKLDARKLSLERQVAGENGEHSTVRAFYVYWFVGQGVTTPSHFSRILLSNWDRVVHNRAHRWAYVSVFALITQDLQPGGLNPEQTQAQLVDFAKQIVPTFQISEMPPRVESRS